MRYKCLSIDDLTRPDHHHLSEEDECLYFMEYTSGKTFAYSDANGLISNFKKPVKRKDLAGYKTKAIDEISKMFAESLAVDGENWTVVPIPPSKSKGHDEYDDRMTRCLQKYLGQRGDFRELLINTVDRKAAHESSVRPTVSDLMDDMEIDENLTEGVRENIAIFDDVLTAGTHFTAAKRMLKQRFPYARIVGIFIARRVLPDAFEDFF